MTVKHQIRTVGKRIRKVRTTPMKAIRYFCIECMGYQPKEVESCKDELCPLFPYKTGKTVK